MKAPKQVDFQTTLINIDEHGMVGIVMTVLVQRRATINVTVTYDDKVVTTKSWSRETALVRCLTALGFKPDTSVLMGMNYYLREAAESLSLKNTAIV